MNERDDVIAIVANLELADYFVIHDIVDVKHNGKKVVAILVEVRDE